MNFSGPPGGNAGIENNVNLLERLALGFGVHEEDVHGHGETEDAENDVRLPGDVREGGSDEEGECEIEDPVRGGGETDTLGTVAEGEDFGGVNPTCEIMH